MKLILASNSPRRRELLGGLDIPYEVYVIKGIDESYPDTLPAKDVAQYIAGKKAEPYKEWFTNKEAIPEGISKVQYDLLLATIVQFKEY